MEKCYEIHGLTITVSYRDGLIGILNDKPLWALADTYDKSAMRLLIQHIHADHADFFGTHLLIPDESFLLEIWGHIYTEYYLLRYASFFRFILRFGKYERFMQSCEVIDCGDRKMDPNRRFWDILSRFNGLFVRLFPKNITGSGLKE